MHTVLQKRHPYQTGFNYGEKTGKCSFKNSDWISAISRGCLMNPSAQWFSVVCDLEKDFVRFHENVLD